MLVNYVNSLSSARYVDTESLALCILYFVAYIAYISAKRMQPFLVEKSHLPVLPSYSMATPGTPQYMPPQPSPLATASYTPPAYASGQMFIAPKPAKT